MSVLSPALVRRLLGAFLAVLAALALGEVALRLLSVRPFLSWSPRYLHVAHEELGLVPRAGFHGRQETAEYSVAVRINSLGLRSPEPVPGARPGVLVLGDSFAFGQGVEEQAGAAQRLAVELGLPVHNAGVMSYGTHQALGRLRELGPRLRPELCVLFFFVGNDPIDNLHSPLTEQHGYVVEAGRELNAWQRMKLALKFHSSLYRIAAEAVHDPEIPGRCSDHTSFGFDLFRREPQPGTEGALEGTAVALAELAATASELGSALVLVAIPTRYQVERTWWERHCEDCSFDPERFDLDRVQDHVAATAERLGLAYLDLRPAFAGAHGPLYFDSLLDMHLNAEGNRVLADALAQFLGERGLIEEAR